MIKSSSRVPFSKIETSTSSLFASVSTWVSSTAIEALHASIWWSESDREVLPSTAGEDTGVPISASAYDPFFAPQLVVADGKVRVMTLFIFGLEESPRFLPRSKRATFALSMKLPI
ncbi:hypothetical protein LXL04_024924 [Taraxacum kok-saghyz]